jgi:hypothetical protein
VLRVKVVDVLQINDILSVACRKIVNGSVTIGTELSDGERRYIVTGIHFVRYVTIEAMVENICLEIKQDGYDERELIGKTLYAT